MPGNFRLVDKAEHSKISIFKDFASCFEDGTNGDKLWSIEVGVDDVLFVGYLTGFISFDNVVVFHNDFLLFGDDWVEGH